jgi:hypothetical protein
VFHIRLCVVKNATGFFAVEPGGLEPRGEFAFKAPTTGDFGKAEKRKCRGGEPRQSGGFPMPDAPGSQARMFGASNSKSPPSKKISLRSVFRFRGAASSLSGLS